MSNYPPPGGYGAYGGYGGGYPSSSGPPPPPGGGYGYGNPYAQSAYNVHQYPSYGGGGYGGYNTGSHPPPQYGGYGGYGGGGYPGQYGQQQQQQPGAVPGFTVPAAPQAAGGPPSRAAQYSMMQNMMSDQALMHTQWEQMKRMGLIEDDEDLEEMKRQFRRRKRRDHEDDEEDIDHDEERRRFEERARKAEEKAKELQEKLSNNDALKEELRNNFVEELMRRQAVSGTFEETMGTIFPFEEYDEDDPVAVWFQEERNQTIVGEGWNPEYDAQYLRKGIKGWGTDESKIINICTTRCNSQRNQILREYKTAYGRDLIRDLKGDLSGNFGEAVLALFETPARYDAWSIKKAIYGAGTRERTLIEILMTRTNAQIQEMVNEYNQITYDKGKASDSIERDIEGDTSGDFKHLLISACQGNRRMIDKDTLAGAIDEVLHEGKWTGMFRVNYHRLVNQEKVERLAQELVAGGEKRLGTDEETFNRIFSTSDYYTLRCVWDEYVKLTQRDILNSVERETSGSYKKGLMAIAQSVKCRPMFFAERLYKSMKGAGTSDSTLIRNVVSRSEIDMVQIKACFLERHNQTLWNFIKHDTSGDYKRLLQAIVGKN